MYSQIADAFESEDLDRVFNTGSKYGYQRAVEETYPEIKTNCTKHRVFDSDCDVCVG